MNAIGEIGESERDKWTWIVLVNRVEVQQLQAVLVKSRRKNHSTRNAYSYNGRKSHGQGSEFQFFFSKCSSNEHVKFVRNIKSKVESKT